MSPTTTGLAVSAAAVAVGCGFVLVKRWLRSNSENIEIKKYEIPRRQNTTPIRIAQLTDIHYDNNEADFLIKALEKSVVAIESNKPNLIVLTGDYVNRDPKPCQLFANRWVHRLISAANHHTKTPIYASLGNHDSCNPSLISGYLKDVGVTVLLNSSIKTEIEGTDIVIIGLADYYSPTWSGAKKAVEEGLSKALPHCRVLILSHNPDTASIISQWVAEYRGSNRDSGSVLVMSGHTHGGQICYPNGYPVLAHVQKLISLFRISRSFWLSRVANVVNNWKYSFGKHHLSNDVTLVVSRGIGTHSSARIFCPPDVTIVDLF